MHIQLTIGTNTKREKITVDNALTPKQVLTQQGIDYSKGQLNLDGSTLTREELNVPLATLLGSAETAMLFSVVKTDNAL